MNTINYFLFCSDLAYKEYIKCEDLSKFPLSFKSHCELFRYDEEEMSPSDSLDRYEAFVRAQPYPIGEVGYTELTEEEYNILKERFAQEQ